MTEQRGPEKNVKRSKPAPAKIYVPKKAASQSGYEPHAGYKRALKKKAENKREKAAAEKAKKQAEALLKAEQFKKEKAEGLVENVSEHQTEREKPIWQPHEGVQTEFLKANEDEVLFSGGRGSGKSDCLIVDPLRYCSNKNFRGLIIRRTMPELRELIGRAKDIYPRAYPGCKWKEMEKLFVFPSGARMEFGYCSNIDDALRYQGQEYTWLGIDEITQYPDDEILEKLKLSLRSPDPAIPIYIRATTNPSGVGRGWVKERWVDLAPSGERVTIVVPTSLGDMKITRKWFQSTVKDNPALLDNNPQYLASLANISNENLRRQWLEGDWDAADGLAFTEFSRDVHVCEPFKIPNNWPKFRACDWGYSSLAVVLWMAVDYDNNIYVYREYTDKLKTADVFAENVRSREYDERIRYGVLDSSVWAKRGEMGETPADTMTRYGLNWMPADRSPGSRKAGKMMIHKYLQVNEETGQPRIKIFNTCKELIAELSNLPLDEKDPEDVDTDAPDHAYDALRYGLMSRPEMFKHSNPFDTGFTDDRPIIVNPVIGM